jgi:L-threonylcarbamoyladenylate synthase
VITLAPDGDPVVAAARLFEALHELDAARLDRIVAQPMPDEGLGLAVMDRLRRAARTDPGVGPAGGVGPAVSDPAEAQ